MDIKFSKWVDSHCHFMNDMMTKEQIEEALDAVKELEFAMAIAPEPSEWDDDLLKVNSIANLYGALGCHPESCENFTSENESRMREYLKSENKLKAVGEIGLDYFYRTDNKKLQHSVFERQLQMALDTSKPVVVHARDSILDCLSILDNFSLKAPLVFHCFTGTLKEAEAILERDFWISYTGILTFPKSEAIREAARITPLNRVMVETDSPFLAPVPYRGKSNKPSWVSYVGEKLAEIHQKSVEEIKHQTTANACEFFQIHL